MRGVTLGALALGGPMILMFALWPLWKAPPDAADRPPDARPSAAEQQPPPAQVRPQKPTPPPQNSARRTAGTPAVLRFAGAVARWRGEQHGEPDAGSLQGRSGQGETLTREAIERNLADADRVLLSRPNDSEAMLAKAEALIRLERFADALPLLRRATEREPDNIKARFHCATALTHVGEAAAAEREFLAVLDRDPDHRAAQFNLAALYQATGRPRDAIELWRRLTQPKPLAAMSLNQGAPGASMPAASYATRPAEKAALLPSVLAEAWFHRGETAQRLSLCDEAESCFLQVLELEPKDPSAWCNLGIARSSMGRREAAIEALNKALELDAGMVPAINQLAFVHAACFRDTKAPEYRRNVLEFCERSLKLAPEQPNIRALRDSVRTTGDDEIALQGARHDG